MAKIEQIESARNYTKERVVIDSFKGVNKAMHNSKIPLDEFETYENFVQLPGSYGSCQNRFGVQRHNANAMTANAIIQLEEVPFGSAYQLIAKDGAGTATMKYVGKPYTGAWTSISAAETSARYQFKLVKNKLYVGNVRSSGLLLANKVWNQSALTEHGCIPPTCNSVIGTRTSYVESSTTGNGLTPSSYYFYLVTYLYDSYQESAAIHTGSMYLSGAGTAIEMAYLPISTNSRVTARKIYRSASTTASIGGPTIPFPEAFYYLTTINDNTTTTFRDVLPDSSLGSAIDPNLLYESNQPYRCKYFTAHKERLIGANLETDSRKYSAIESLDIAAVSANNAAGLLVPGDSYVYRIAKAYPAHVSGRQTWVIGKYAEVTQTVGVGHNTIILSIDANNWVYDSEWLGHIYVERTLANLQDFYPLWAGLWYQNFSSNQPYNTELCFNKEDISTDSGGIVDVFSDANLLLLQGDPAVDVITAGEFTSQYSFPNYISISQVNEPDRFSGNAIKFTNSDDNQGITGIYSEQDRVIMFKPTSIYQMSTNSESSDFWGITVVERNIGAAGQRVAPLTETIGHNGILQLPQPTEYIFFDKAYSDTATDRIKIYYWHSYGKPKTISNAIEPYLTGSTDFSVNGMTYDRENNWAWILIRKSTTPTILIYDLNTESWYVFTFDTGVVFNDIITLEDGRILLAGNAGFVYIYSNSVYYDTYGGSNKFTYAKIKSHSIDDYDTRLVLTAFNGAFDTSTAGAELLVRSYVDDSSATILNYSDGSNTSHRPRITINSPGNRLAIEAEFTIASSNNKRYIVNGLMFDFKRYHKLDRGSRD